MILVINPNNRIQRKSAAIEPPLWAGLIASYHHAELIDAEALNLSLDQTTYEVKRRHPEKTIIVVMGNNPSVSSTPKMPVTEALADSIGKNVYLTGIHPIAVNYRKYPVISVPFQGTPSIAYDLLPMELYRAHNWHCLDGSPRNPYASVYTSLGCPYSCYYCNIHTLYPEHKQILRPVKDIVKEIDKLVTIHKVRNIKFWDELFALNEDRVSTICSYLECYNLNIWAYARIDTVTPSMLNAMKRGGINWLAYGFESVEDKKIVTRTEEVIDMTRHYGINIMGNFMFGLPGETEDAGKRTLEFAMRHLFEYVNFYVAKPYPGSQWYNDTKPTDGWNDYDQYGKKRNSFRDEAFKTYFENPDYLAMVERKFGQAGLKNIREMLDGN